MDLDPEDKESLSIPWVCLLCWWKGEAGAMIVTIEKDLILSCPRCASTKVCRADGHVEFITVWSGQIPSVLN
jgi:hypothetical protein